jgi:hypothetical protein
MHADRLIKLAELLEADAINPKGLKFDLSLWGSSNEYDDDGLDDTYAPPVSISCGTHACAMGLAVLSGEFAEFGLINASHNKSSIVPEIAGTKAFGFQAAEVLFGIDEKQAYNFFCAEFYPDEITTGKEGELLVAARIREFVADELLELQPA